MEVLGSSVFGMNESFGSRDVLVGWLAGWFLEPPFFLFGRDFFVDLGVS